MAKQLKDTDLLKIVKDAIEGDNIDDMGNYLTFLGELGELLCDHFGGNCHGAKHDSITNENIVYFSANESLPDSGGVFEEFDTSTIWRDGKEYDYDDPNQQKMEM